MTSAAWICACGAASQQGFATRALARRNAGRHHRRGCTAAGRAFNILDLADPQQRALWGDQRRQQLERAARGTIAGYLRGLAPGSAQARLMGCPCPGGVASDDAMLLTIRPQCPVHGAWTRGVAK